MPDRLVSRPYPHQVGGHGQLTVTDLGYLVKPSSVKEVAFYTYIYGVELPHDLRWIRNVTPHFYGQADDAGSVIPQHHHSHPPATFALSPTKPCPSQKPLRWRTLDGTTGVSISPWAAQMKSRRHNSSNPARRPRPNIALEDINREFVLPCVMDCKIGTRHYDNDASEEKRKRHIQKANSTTTAKCGVRYTGMQSLKREKRHDEIGVFELRDKYYGRTLREEHLVPEATWFFHDSHRVRADCVQLMLSKLMELRRHLLEQHHFYFYSSSLLLVYEGALPEVAPPRVDVRMIDFAHTIRSYGKRDDGYLYGINYLIQILGNVMENAPAQVPVIPRRLTNSASALNDTDELVEPVAENAVAGPSASNFDQAPVVESAESPVT